MLKILDGNKFDLVIFISDDGWLDSLGDLPDFPEEVFLIGITQVHALHSPLLGVVVFMNPHENDATVGIEKCTHGFLENGYPFVVEGELVVLILKHQILRFSDDFLFEEKLSATQGNMLILRNVFRFQLYPFIDGFIVIVFFLYLGFVFGVDVCCCFFEIVFILEFYGVELPLDPCSQDGIDFDLYAP